MDPDRLAGSRASRPSSADTEADPEGWVDRHGDCLYRYALLRLRAPDLAADVVQETFVEALRARHTFSGRSTERTWLVGILRHKILDHFRRQRRERRGGDVEAIEEVSEPQFDRRGLWRDGPAAWRGDPGRDIETQEFWNVFSRCLSKLPEGVASAFFLREVDGLESDEVQQLLGISAANLWTRLHRARLLLRECLETHWFGPGHRTPPSKGPDRS